MPTITPEETVRVIANRRALTIGVYAQVSDCFKKIDFSWLGLKAYKVDSSGFRKYLRVLAVDAESARRLEEVYVYFSTEMAGGYKELWVLVPTNLAKPVDERVFLEIEKILLILFPSDFYMAAKVYYHVVSSDPFNYDETYWSSKEGNSFWHLTGADWSRTWEFKLHFEDKISKKVNSFFKLAYSSIEENKEFFQIPVSIYHDSFSQAEENMAYLNYCMSLESLFNNGTGEITYQLGRACAFLNAETAASGEGMFKAVKEVYSVRSALVHNGKDHSSYGSVRGFFFFIQSLASRTLIELITLGVVDKNDFLNSLATLGYGDKKKLNRKYRKVELNVLVEGHISSVVVANTLRILQSKTGKAKTEK